MPEPEDTRDEAETPSYPPEVPTDRPTSARVYGWLLGGKDNFEVDRQFALAGLQLFPEALDVARENRQFLYRAVRFLARDAGVRQFLDLGSGLPTNSNVHQVAQELQPDARVVYVDIDPIVLVHGRALLAHNDNTTVITADMTEPETILEHEDARRLIDFSEPVAVLMFSITHTIPDDETALRTILGPLEHVVPGSYLAASHVVADDAAVAAKATQAAADLGVAWKTRHVAQVDAWLAGLEPVEPGLVDINTWRPDPDQPQLSDVDPALQPFLGAAATRKAIFEYGGILRKP